MFPAAHDLVATSDRGVVNPVVSIVCMRKITTRGDLGRSAMGEGSSRFSS